MAKNYSAMAPMTRKEHTIYYILYTILYLLSLLPFRVLYLLSDIIFFFTYYVGKYRKKIVERNLKECFPEKSEKELLKIERGFYHYLCDYIFETIKLTSMSRSQMQRHMKFRGIEHVNKALADGHNVALYLAHYCNWEWVTSISIILPQNALRGQVYHVLESKVIDRLMLKIRSRMESVNIERNKLLRHVVLAEREGKHSVIGFMSDQGPEMHNIHYWTRFLNHETAVITGTETLAKKCNFSCVYLDIKRVRRGYYEADIIPMVEDPTTMPDFEITEMYAQLLEKNIRRQPEFWLWTHNRWKRTRAMHKEFLRTHPQNRR